MSVLDSAPVHPKYGYRQITSDIACQMTAADYAAIYPAQRAACNKMRKQAGLPPFTRADAAANGVRVEVKTKDQLVAAVEDQRELDREPPEAVKSPKAKTPKRPTKKKGLFGRRAAAGA